MENKISAQLDDGRTLYIHSDQEIEKEYNIPLPTNRHMYDWLSSLTHVLLHNCIQHIEPNSTKRGNTYIRLVIGKNACLLCYGGYAVRWLQTRA